MRLKFKKLHPNAILPVYATKGAAGMDLHACLDEPVCLHPGEAAAVPTGLAMELPENYEAQIRGRSGLAFKNAVFSYNGTIDADYRGEIKGLLINHSKVPFIIQPGMRICQMIINAAVVKCRPEWVDEINETARGEGGFGSTGLAATPKEAGHCGFVEAEYAHLHTPIDETAVEIQNLKNGYVPYNQSMGDDEVDQDVIKDALLKVSRGEA